MFLEEGKIKDFLLIEKFEFVSFLVLIFEISVVMCLFFSSWGFWLGILNLMIMFKMLFRIFIVDVVMVCV